MRGPRERSNEDEQQNEYGNRAHAGVWLVFRREFATTCAIVNAEKRA